MLGDLYFAIRKYLGIDPFEAEIEDVIPIIDDSNPSNGCFLLVDEFNMQNIMDGDGMNAFENIVML